MRMERTAQKALFVRFVDEDDDEDGEAVELVGVLDG